MQIGISKQLDDYMDRIVKNCGNMYINGFQVWVLGSAKDKPAGDEIATLAGEGTFDHELAPVRTRVAKLSYNVDRFAKADRIQSATASQVRGRVALANKLLDDAAAADKAGDAARARDQLKWAKAAVEDGEAKLSGASR